MKYQPALKWMIPLIAVLALFATCMGLFYHTGGHAYPLTSFRGEQVQINGDGLYYFDTVSTTAQMQGNDLITMVVGLPLLLVSAWMAFRGSMRGRLLVTGTLGFFLYTYISMSVLTAYNGLFLVYVALWGLTLYAFVLCMLSFDLSSLPGHFSPTLRRGWVAADLFAIGGFLALAWLGRIVPELMHPEIPPALENTTTRVIQAMDLTLIAPLAILAGILLLRRSAWGYLLASVAVMKGLTMALAVSTMAVNMALRGVPDSLGIMVPFIVLTIFNLVVGAMLLRSIKSAPQAIPAARRA
jgi:hypothetical protein